jgi:hypothetical protein
MKRVERKLFLLSDEIEALDRAEYLALEELNYHLHLNDDAQRDAAVSDHPIDRADARETASDVSRFESHLERLRAKRSRLQVKRDRLVDRLGN